MRNLILEMLVVAVAVVGLQMSVFAQRADEDTTAPETGAVAAGETEAAGDESKLLKWTTLEDAFLRANQNRVTLRRKILQLKQALKQTEDKEEKKKINKQIANLQKELRKWRTAMGIVFGIGGRRDYVYNRVKSTIYLEVGTVEEAFGRAVNTREALRKFIAGKREELENAEDDEKKEELEGQIERATRQYRVIAAALQMIYGVTPKRNYTYNPNNATLYLNVSEEELDDLRKQRSERQQEQ